MYIVRSKVLVCLHFAKARAHGNAKNKSDLTKYCFLLLFFLSKSHLFFSQKIQLFLSYYSHRHAWMDGPVN